MALHKTCEITTYQPPHKHKSTAEIKSALQDLYQMLQLAKSDLAFYGYDWSSVGEIRLDPTSSLPDT